MKGAVRQHLRPVGELTVQTAAESKNSLLSALQTGSGIDLDLSGVSELDTAGLQLLLLLKREAEHLGKPLNVITPSAAVLEVLQLTRLDLQLDQLISPVFHHLPEGRN